MDAAAVPEGLAAMPPGPALAAALGSVELARVANDRMLEVLNAQYRQLCHEQARMIATVAEIGRCEGYPEPGAVIRLPEPERYAAEETRAALRWTRNAAECEHELAETVVHSMPQVFAAWWAGELDRQRVRMFDRYLTGLSSEVVSMICRVTVPRAPKLTTGQLAALLCRMVIAADPDAAARWYRKGIRERNVSAYPSADGTITLSANGLPADEAEAACARIEDLAGAARRAGHPGRIGQIRCDLFLGLLDGRFHHMTSEQVIATLLAEHPTAQHPTAQHPTAGSGRPTAGAAPTEGPADGDGLGGSGGAGGSGEDTGEDTGDSDSPNGGEDSGDSDCGESEGGESEGGESEGGESEGGDKSGTTGSLVPHDDRRGIEIRVALSTLLGRDDQPAEIPGLGLLVAPAARARVALQRRAQWRFAVTDTEGHLITEGVTRRRPLSVRQAGGPPGGIVELHVPATLLREMVDGEVEPGEEWAGVIADIARQCARRHEHLRDLDARPGDRLPAAALRRHTEIRDRTCTHPCCRRRAHASDQDHTHDHGRGGTTVRVNLGPTCAHDHDVKHGAGWLVEQPEPGTFVWRSPLGGEYRSRGEFLHPRMPSPALAEAAAAAEPEEPEGSDGGRYDEGPILRPPAFPNAARRRAPPPAPASTDEPPF